MKSIFSSIPDILSSINNVRAMDVIDITIVSVLIFFIIALLRKAQSYKVFQGIMIILVALWLSDALQLYTLNYILRNIVQVGVLSMVILFQPEIRRFLEKLGNGASINRLLGGSREYTAENAITQTVLACKSMSESRTGALIIFERDNRLDDQIRTGTIVNADLTAELLKNIFYPKAPLHDGAVIIRNGRILAGGCMLPLSQNPNLSKELGMRHRAGIGISEASDALVVIVSEETGAISLAEGGMLKRHLSRENFEKILRIGLINDEEKKTFSLRDFLRGIKEKRNEK